MRASRPSMYFFMIASSLVGRSWDSSRHSSSDRPAFVSVGATPCGCCFLMGRRVPLILVLLWRCMFFILLDWSHKFLGTLIGNSRFGKHAVAKAASCVVRLGRRLAV